MNVFNENERLFGTSSSEAADQPQPSQREQLEKAYQEMEVRNRAESIINRLGGRRADPALIRGIGQYLANYNQ